MHLESLKQTLALILIGVIGFVGVLGVQLANTSKADAASVGFCGNVLLGPLPGGSGQTWCQVGIIYGAYQAYGWGEHSVCVELPPLGSRACSSGTNGVYSGTAPAGLEYGYPTIKNNTGTAQYASGIYLTH